MPERSQKKIIVINGSPKKDKSFTMTVTNAFVKGIEQEGGVAELINISDLDITPCRGCLSCWGRTAGECVIKGDDIPMLREKLKAADRIVISFPLFFFGMPGMLKVAVDRLLGMLETYRGMMPSPDADLASRMRYAKEGQGIAVISSCGFSESAAVFEPLREQLELILGRGNYTAIFCPELKALIDTGKGRKLPAYLAKVEAAGVTFGKEGKLDEATMAELSKPPFMPETYRILTENFWKEQEGSDTR